MNKEKKDVLSGVFWKFLERIFAQLVTTAVAIILARLLSPSEYGTISLVTVFITIANVFVTSGFGEALIQKKDADNNDFSTVLYFSIFFSVIIYCILFLLAIPISMFYDMPILIPVIRILSLSIPIMGINSVQQAYVARNMIFKKFFNATLAGTMISGVIGIFMAYRGFGVWSLVTQMLTNQIINTIILQFSINWKPILFFSFKRLKVLFNFGWKLLIQSLILNLYSNLRNLIIGKVYTASDLAYYTRGNQFPNLISTNIDTAINSALFPAMAKVQNSNERVKIMARRTIQISSYILNPALIGFIAVAEPFISILLTDTWLPAVIYLRICCVILLFRAPQTAILQAIKAIGRSDVILKVDIPIRVFALIVLIVSVRFGVVFFAASEILTTVFGTILYIMMGQRLINYSIKEVCLDFMVNTFVALIMGIFIYCLGEFLNINKYSIFLVQVICGIVIYFFVSMITKNESFCYLKDMIIDIIKKRKKGC